MNPGDRYSFRFRLPIRWHPKTEKVKVAPPAGTPGYPAETWREYGAVHASAGNALFRLGQSRSPYQRQVERLFKTSVLLGLVDAAGTIEHPHVQRTLKLVTLTDNIVKRLGKLLSETGGKPRSQRPPGPRNPMTAPEALLIHHWIGDGTLPDLACFTDRALVDLISIVTKDDDINDYLVVKLRQRLRLRKATRFVIMRDGYWKPASAITFVMERDGQILARM